MVGREPSGILKGEWAGDKTLGETHPLLSKWGKWPPVEDPEKESRGVEGKPGESESWMPKIQTISKRK